MYVTSPNGKLIRLVLRDVTSRHVFVPFENNNKGQRTVSRDICRLDGTGMLEGYATLDIVGTQGARTSELQVSIYGYQEEEEPPEYPAIAAWEHSQQGWSCRIGVYKKESTSKYEWYAAIKISQPLFKELLEIYRSKKLFNLRLELRMNLFVSHDNRYDADEARVSFIVPDKGDLKVALGYVEYVLFEEASLALRTEGRPEDALLDSTEQARRPWWRRLID